MPASFGWNHTRFRRGSPKILLSFPLSRNRGQSPSFFILEYTVEEYLDAVEWCIRNKLFQAGAELPAEVPACIKNHSLGPEVVVRQAREFGEMYRYRAGSKPDSNVQQTSSADTASESG